MGFSRTQVVTDVFDSLDEGVDALVATIRRDAPGEDDADDEELYESLDELRRDADEWREPPAASEPAARGDEPDLRDDERPDDLRPGRARMTEAKMGAAVRFRACRFYVSRDNDTLVTGSASKTKESQDTVKPYGPSGERI